MIPDELVIASVLAMRFLVPLTMLRYPLPGMVASILADAVDGAILSAFSDLTRENKQNYDKALDTYYLAIAYIAVLRNWSDPVALQIGRFLWYLRLTGVALFAVVGTREVLLFFPASFEFFFIYYEAARSRWDWRRLTQKHLMVAALVVTFALKLPQEFFVHVARWSLNDLLKQHLFGVDPSTSRLDAAAENPAALLVLLGMVAMLLAAAWWSRGWLPAADHRVRLDTNAHGPAAIALATRRRRPRPIGGWLLVEKIALVALTSIVFAEFLPGVQASAAQMIIAVSIFILINSAISDWIARRGGEWRTALYEFVAMAVINAGIVLLMATLTRWTDARIDAVTALFYALLFTLLITLYDRYRASEPPGEPATAGSSAIRASGPVST